MPNGIDYQTIPTRAQTGRKASLTFGLAQAIAKHCADYWGYLALHGMTEQQLRFADYMSTTSVFDYYLGVGEELWDAKSRLRMSIQIARGMAIAELHGFTGIPELTLHISGAARPRKISVVVVS